jgi:hypothetical protein
MTGVMLITYLHIRTSIIDDFSNVVAFACTGCVRF